MDFDKYAILAQILRWAKDLDYTAESSNADALKVCREMRRFVAAVVNLEVDHAG